MHPQRGAWVFRWTFSPPFPSHLQLGHCKDNLSMQRRRRRNTSHSTNFPGKMEYGSVLQMRSCSKTMSDAWGLIHLSWDWSPYRLHQVGCCEIALNFVTLLNHRSAPIEAPSIVLRACAVSWLLRGCFMDHHNCTHEDDFQIYLNYNFVQTFHSVADVQ